MRIHDFAPVPLTRKKLLIGSAVGAFLLGMMCLVPLAQERVLELGAHELSEAQILVRADEVMREKGVDPAAYIRTVSSNSMNLPVARYMLQYGSLDQLTAFLKEHWSDVRWEVRYFKILEKEEFTLTLDKWGRLYRYVHHILDEAPGAQLDEAAALALVRSSLLNEHGIDTTQMKLISIDPTKEKNRRDYYVAFEKDNIGWGEAKLRVAISLKGDEPERFSQWVNVPESWTREQRKSGLREVLGKIAEKWTSLAALILGATFLIFLLRRREIPWRLAFVIGLFPFSLAFLDILNDLPHFYRSYSTTTPEANFIIFKVGGMVARLVGAYISGVVLAAVSLGVFRWAFGARLADLVWWPQDRAARQTFLWQTALITIFAVICLRFESFVVNLYAGHVLPSWTASSTHFSVDEALPWLKAITQPLRIGFTKTLSLMFYAGVVILALRRWPRSTWVVLALIPFMGALGADTWSEFFYTAGKTAVSYGLILFLALAVWRFNIVAVFLSYALSTYATWIAFIWTKGGPPYRWEVGPPLVLLVLLVIGVLVLHRRQGIAKLSPTC